MICPLLKSDCVQKKCAWWLSRADACSIYMIAGNLDALWEEDGDSNLSKLATSLWRIAEKHGDEL